MKSFFLAEIATKDGLIHQGIIFKPQKPSKRVLLWIHGLTGRFYGDVTFMNLFAEICDKRGMGFASFNTRGHDMIASAHKTDETYANIGGGREVFEECVYDIDAAVKFLVQQGFSEVILVGLSTGANKACYYAATQANKHIAGIALVSPLSDRLIPSIRIRWYERFFLKLLVVIGKGDILISGKSYFPGTPNRFLSLLTPHSNEDVFDYADIEPALVRFSAIKKPLLVLLAAQDELADRSIIDIKKAFDSHQKSKLYKSFIIPGAMHSFKGKEKEAVGAICDWVSSI